MAQIEWADVILPGPDTVIRVHISDYDRELHGTNLICPHPRCDAKLSPVGEHKARGGEIVSAHFKRQAGEVHKRKAGCQFPNTPEDHKSKGRIAGLNRIIQFFETRQGGRVIYLNTPMSEFVQLPRSLKHRLQYQAGHKTAKTTHNDRTLTVKTAKDLKKIGDYCSFENDPFNRVKIRVNDYMIPFRAMDALSYERALRMAQRDYKRGETRTVLRPAFTRVSPRSHIGENHNSGSYFMYCEPQQLEGQQSGFVYNIRPEIATRHPELLEGFQDSTRYLVQGLLQPIDQKQVKSFAREIREGKRENALPVRIWIESPDQFVPVNR